MSESNKVTVVLGAQWGDEGKGKLVDVLCQEMDVCARFNGGNNAGHSIKVGDVSFAFHLLPSGMVNKECMNVLGNGVVIHVPSLFEEIDDTEKKGVSTAGRLLVSTRAHVVFDAHQCVDGRSERVRGKGALGTTKKGIGPCYASKANRVGVRIGDLVGKDANIESALKKVHDHLLLVNAQEDLVDKSDKKIELSAEVKRYTELAKRLEPMVCDTISYMHQVLREGKRVLVEGANATMLDIDFGTYPYVTSSNPSTGGVLTGLGINQHQLGDVFGVVKAYTTRVGAGPFPTEQLNKIGEHLQQVGHEFGTTTGRKRRCGWLDLVVIRYTHLLNGYTAINLTKLDVLSGLEEIKIGVAYSIVGGEETPFAMPACLSDLEKVKVRYETLPGWKEDISKCSEFSELPAAAQRYVRRIEQLIGVPVRWIGVGPGRDSMVNVPPVVDMDKMKADLTEMRKQLDDSKKETTMAQYETLKLELLAQQKRNEELTKRLTMFVDLVRDAGDANAEK